jgi:hypothetical protein
MPAFLDVPWQPAFHSAPAKHIALALERFMEFREARESHLNDEDTTATPDDSGVGFQLLSFFYVVKEDRYFDSINIFIPEALKPRTSIPFAVGLKQRKKEEGES